MKVSYNSEAKQYTYEDDVYNVTITNSCVKALKNDDFGYINTDLLWNDVVKDKCENLKNRICKWISPENTIGDRKLNTICKMIDCIIVSKNKINNTSTYEKRYETFPNGVDVEIILENNVITHVIMPQSHFKFMRNGEIDIIDPDQYISDIANVGGVGGGVINILNKIDDSLRGLHGDGKMFSYWEPAIFVRECIYIYKARLNMYNPDFVDKSRRDFPIVYSNKSDWIDIHFRAYRGYTFFKYVGISSHQCYDILIENDDASKAMIKQIRKENSIADDVNIIIKIDIDCMDADRTARFVFISGNDPLTCSLGMTPDTCVTGNKANIMKIVRDVVIKSRNKRNNSILDVIADGRVIVLNSKIPKKLKGVIRTSDPWDMTIMREFCKSCFSKNVFSLYNASLVYFKIAEDQYFVFKSFVRKENTFCNKEGLMKDIERLKHRSFCEDVTY